MKNTCECYNLNVNFSLKLQSKVGLHYNQGFMVYTNTKLKNIMTLHFRIDSSKPAML